MHEKYVQFRICKISPLKKCNAFDLNSYTANKFYKSHFKYKKIKTNLTIRSYYLSCNFLFVSFFSLDVLERASAKTQNDYVAGGRRWNFHHEREEKMYNAIYIDDFISIGFFHFILFISLSYSWFCYWFSLFKAFFFDTNYHQFYIRLI